MSDDRHAAGRRGRPATLVRGVSPSHQCDRGSYNRAAHISGCRLYSRMSTAHPGSMVGRTFSLRGRVQPRPRPRPARGRASTRAWPRPGPLRTVLPIGCARDAALQSGARMRGVLDRPGRCKYWSPPLPDRRFSAALAGGSQPFQPCGAFCPWLDGYKSSDGSGLSNAPLSRTPSFSSTASPVCPYPRA